MHPPKPTAPLVFALALLAVLALTAALHPLLSRAAAYQPAYVLTDAVQEEVNNSSFALILGEVRASLADVMWIKTERYLHRGVAYKPHLDADALAHTGQLVSEGDAGHGDNDHDGHPHEGLHALVPDADHDYRSFIGTLQRAVQPWKGPGAPDEHTAGDELVPWYRLLTYSDPHHWRGYMIGSWWLTKIQGDAGALGEASAFIEEGIRNNPEVFQLQIMDGRIRIQQERWREAIPCFEKAVALALKVRPADGKEKPPLWTESDEEDFAAALRYIGSIQWHRLNDPAAARLSVGRALTLLPQDGPLRALQGQLTQAKP